MKKILSFGLVLLALGVAAALADDKKTRKEDATTRSVQGVVEDASGQPVEGAVVQLKDTKTLQIRSFITKPDGSYYFHRLSKNIDYELKADHKPASSGVRTLSVFNSDKTAVMNLKLK